MEYLIKEILEKHNIKDENLANALAEIYQVFYKQSQSDMESDYRLKALMKGITL
jgi:hypothetical protein